MAMNGCLCSKTDAGSDLGKYKIVIVPYKVHKQKKNWLIVLNSFNLLTTHDFLIIHLLFIHHLCIFSNCFIRVMVDLEPISDAQDAKQE